jgi:D-glycero-alpha-D-manno-heptose 1-phosphate guanylyltransferase
MQLQAIILAGGLGTRLRPTVPDLPKAMAPIAGRPFLEILLDLLAQKGFGRIILSVGYLSEKIIDYFGDCFEDMELVYSVEQNPLGTGGATRQALTHCDVDHAFVFNGDTYLDLEAELVEAHWLQYRKPIIVARELTDTTRFGRIEMQGGRVNRFLGKGIPGPGLIDAGCYLLPVNLLEKFQLGQTFSLEMDFLVDALQNDEFDCFVTRGNFIDIGIPEDYRRAQQELIMGVK